MSGSYVQQPSLPNLGVSRQRMRFAAWLALASMLLVFGGPLYSNSQALLGAKTHHSQPSGFDTHASGAHFGEAATGAKHVQNAPDPIPMEHAECGYCVLLTHSAPLTPEVLAVAPLPPWAQVRQSRPSHENIYSYRPYTLAQGRAPPHLTV